MSDNCLLGLKKLVKSFKKAQKNNILLLIILVAATSLFFSVLFKPYVMAKKGFISHEADLEALDPMVRICQKTITSQKEENKEFCQANGENESSKSKEDALKEDKYREIVKNHPIEVMVPKISQENEAVAAFLIGIAKKESDWGKHSPKKNGRDCYNYWGYRGGYNATDSGYSCFDSPEQAIDVVGGRIEELVNKKIDTPSRMIVWKCGRTCEGHDPAGVKKWISDVSLYYNKLVS